jgi:putative addiction module component (TIGR02574 family)
MGNQAVKVLTDALPIEDRAALIDSLVESLDPTADQDAQEACKAELGRRIEEIDSGAVELTPWQVARRRLRNRLQA